MEAVTVVGAGGIGCAVGYALRAAGCPVTFVDAEPTKVAWGRRHGVAVAGRPTLSAQFERFDDWRPDSSGVNFLCTKCYDNPAVLARLPESAVVIPVQNGFDSLLERRCHALEGIASFVSECPLNRPETRITRPGKLHFGPRSGAKPHAGLLEKATAALRAGRLFPVVEVAAIEPYKYTKLMYNAAISPLAAAAGIDNGQLLSVPAARRLFFALLQENYRILSGAGVHLGKIGPFRPATVAGILRQRWLARLLARAFEPSLRGTYCSMAPDLPRGRTEIDYYNRRLIDLAGETPCPLNRAVVRLINRMEQQRIPAHRNALDELIDYLPA